ncbi:MAG: MGMT family protein [Candidatus Moduliflexus flocculans]|nr:MGMT family protein [Candidatus Moduliflexus flocculans]
MLNAVRRIPPGRVCTYGGIAALAGRPRAWRAVGNIMAACDAPGTPCHRVVAAGGRLGGYGGNPAMKRALLAAEGVSVAGGRIRDWRLVTLAGPAPGPGRAGTAAQPSPYPRGNAVRER